MKLGFIVGKFYPPHHGHKYFIETARKHVDHLVVLIAAHPLQSISGETRLRWMKEIHPNCDVRMVRDELADDSEAWAKFTIAFLGRAPDVLFTSESYGPEYAEFMGCKHVSIDQPRTKFPISGTLIRARPLDYLSFLEPCVRAHYVLRVVLVGAESTGKTTLSRNLAKHFQTNWVPEYGREHWETKVAGVDVEKVQPSWTPEEFVHIATTQKEREEAAARTANRILFCDTNSFATGTWYERYYGNRSGLVDQIGKSDRADLYLFCRTDAPFVQDGFRDGERIRGWMDSRFETQLTELKLPFVSLAGGFEARTKLAIASVEKLVRR